MNIVSLKDLRERVKKVVIGQDEVVDAVSLCIYKFYLKNCMQYVDDSFNFQNPSILVRGKSGTGKTFAIQSICSELKLPYVEINSKSICQEGWSGKSFSEIIVTMLKMNDIDKDDAVVVVLDEFDKLVSHTSSSTSDKYNHQIQSSLLKYIEGHEGLGEGGMFSTKNFCFIFAGAFYGLKEQITKKEIGFNACINESKDVEDLVESFVEYGMLPEILGRISMFAKTKDFDIGMYKQLLNSESFNFKKWKLLFDNIKVSLNLSTDEELQLCEQAVKKNLGARGLNQLLETRINNHLESNIDKLDVNSLVVELLNKKRELEALEEAKQPSTFDNDEYMD